MLLSPTPVSGLGSENPLPLSTLLPTRQPISHWLCFSLTPLHQTRKRPSSKVSSTFRPSRKSTTTTYAVPSRWSPSLVLPCPHGWSPTSQILAYPLEKGHPQPLLSGSSIQHRKPNRSFHCRAPKLRAQSLTLSHSYFSWNKSLRAEIWQIQMPSQEWMTELGKVRTEAAWEHWKERIIT